jgi:hypothetical protein
MGLGVLVDTDVHRCAALVSSGDYTMWVRVPGGARRDMYFCVMYFPVYRDQKNKAIEEMLQGYLVYRPKGVVVMGGDLNVRCGMNGDGVINTAGRAFMRLAKKHNMTFVNAMELAEGLFSRQQWVQLYKDTPKPEWVLRQTTIDYTLICEQDSSRVHAYEVGEELGEDASDHRVQALTLDMDDTGGGSKAKDKPILKEQWDLAHMDTEDWDAFEAASDGHMVDWMTGFEPTGPQDSAQAGWHFEQWLKSFNQAGMDVIGRRRVGSGSKGWYPELLPVLEERRAAGRAVRESLGASKVAAKERLAELRRKLRSVSKRCKREACQLG